MKLGDMVIVSFGGTSETVVGVYICDDMHSCGEDRNGDKILTRGEVFWDGDIISTPLDQIEVISESV